MRDFEKVYAFSDSEERKFVLCRKRVNAPFDDRYVLCSVRVDLVGNEYFDPCVLDDCWNSVLVQLHLLARGKS